MTNERTGRTTRMLQAAIAAAEEGKYVMVYAASRQHADELQRRAATMVGTEPYATKIRTPGNGEITFESAQDGRLSWDTMRPRVWRSIPVFTDHWAIESHLAKALEELHRFDVEASDGDKQA